MSTQEIIKDNDLLHAQVVQDDINYLTHSKHTRRMAGNFQDLLDLACKLVDAPAHDWEDIVGEFEEFLR